MQAKRCWWILLINLIINTPTAQADGFPPRFLGAQKLQYSTKVGNIIRLRCKVTGIPRPTISWTKDEKPLQLSSRIRNLNSNSLVKIKGAILSDQGNYSCMAENARGKTNATMVLEVIGGAPAFTDPDKMKRAFISWPASHTYRLKCLATGAPPLKYAWFKDGKKVTTRRLDPYWNTTTWFLRLKESELTDTGKYTCKVSNKYGTINHTYTFEVVAKARSRPILNTNHPKNTTARLGDNATMSCIVLLSGTLPDIRWLKWNKVTTAQPKVTDDLENGSYHLIDPIHCKTIQVDEYYGFELAIVNVTEKDLGLYTCYVRNHIGNDYRSAYLSRYVKPTVPTHNDGFPQRFLGTQKLQYITAVGTFIRLRCEVTGVPPPSISWTKDGKPLQLSSRIRNLNNNSIVEIKEAILSDQGNYSCIAENALGKMRETMVLEVIGDEKAEVDVAKSCCDAPAFTYPDIMKRAFIAWPVSHTYRLKCKATGAPPLKYTWFKDGKKVTTRRLDPYWITTTWFLRLKELVPTDTGKYTCKVSNRYGTINHTYTLEVVAKARSRPILCTNHTKNTTTRLGDNATMFCIVLFSGTLPDIRWLKWNKVTTAQPKVTDDLENGSYHLIDPIHYKTIQVDECYGVELAIVNVTEKDLGLYTCHVSNHIGSDYRSAYLSRYVKPTVPTHNDGFPPRSLGTQKLQYITAVGTFIRLRCEVTGVPPPTISWTKDGKPLQLSSRIRNLNNNSIVEIKEAILSDQGNYSCMAKNALGKIRETMVLEVIGVLGAPTFMDPNKMRRAFIVWPASHTYRLKCEANGAPPLKYAWFKDGKKVTTRRLDPHMNTTTWFLALKELVPTDSGKYTCKVSNRYGAISHTYTLTVVTGQ